MIDQRKYFSQITFCLRHARVILKSTVSLFTLLFTSKEEEGVKEGSLLMDICKRTNSHVYKNKKYVLFRL